MPSVEHAVDQARALGAAVTSTTLPAIDRAWGTFRAVNGYTWRTISVLVTVTLLFLLFGLAIGGPWGLLIFAIIAIGWVGYSFWFSDKMVLTQMDAVRVNEKEAPELVAAVKRATEQFGVPVPAVYVIDTPVPNAFATGRSPDHAAIAVTTGLQSVLDEREMYSVITHEIAHIRNRDTMWSCMIAAMCWGVMLTMKPILWISQALAWIGSLLVALSVALNWGFIGSMIALIAALYGHTARLTALAVNWLVDLILRLLQSAANRQREHFADDVGGRVGGDPQGLASALAKIEQISQSPEIEEAVAALSSTGVANHLFISNPFSGASVRLLSTHPRTSDRIERLGIIHQELHHRSESREAQSIYVEASVDD